MALCKPSGSVTLQIIPTLTKSSHLMRVTKMLWVQDLSDIKDPQLQLLDSHRRKTHQTAPTAIKFSRTTIEVSQLQDSHRRKSLQTALTLIRSSHTTRVLPILELETPTTQELPTLLPVLSKLDSPKE